MNLSKEQIEKMKEKLITFCEELGEMIKGKNIDLDIPLASNYNTYGGLELKIHNTYFGYTTNKTRYNKSKCSFIQRFTPPQKPAVLPISII